jgi:hypothetical protein
MRCESNKREGEESSITSMPAYQPDVNSKNNFNCQNNPPCRIQSADTDCNRSAPIPLLYVLSLQVVRESIVSANVSTAAANHNTD